MFTKKTEMALVSLRSHAPFVCHLIWEYYAWIYATKWIPRSQNMFWYSWKFEISLALIIWKTIQKRPAILPKFLLIFVSYTCNFFVILFLVPLFSLKSFISAVVHPTLCEASFSFLFCLLILPDVDSMHFVTFLLLHVKCINRKWFTVC